MSQIFISFSNDIDFATDLQKRLEESGFDVWIYLEDIPPTVDWLNEIYDGIEKSDVFLFLLSPDSIRSETCQKEIDHAVKNGKRIVPLLVRKVEFKVVRQEISKIQAISFENLGEFNDAYDELITYINKDFTWVKFHSELQNKALAWERAEKDTSRLFRGKELREAEEFLAQASNETDPQPTQLQRSYILTSRKHENQRRQLTIVGLSIGLAIMIILSFIALDQRNQAIASEETAIAKEKARATAQKEAEIQEDIAIAKEKARATAQTEAEIQADIAEERRKLALARQIAVQAELVRTGQPNQLEQSVLLAIESLIRFQALGEPSQQVYQTLLQGLSLLPRHTQDLIHPENINAIAYSSDGQWIATSMVDPMHTGYPVMIWNAADGEETFRLETQARVTDLEFSPDSQYIVTAGSHGLAQIWDLSNGEEIKTLDHKIYITDLAFSQDANTLVTAGQDGSILVWNWNDPEPRPVHLYHDQSAVALAISPNGQYLATASIDETVRIWELPWGPEIGRMKFSPGSDAFTHLSSHNPSSILAFSPDSALLAVGGDDGRVQIWETATRQERPHLQHENSVTAVTFGPHNRYLASASIDETARIWELKSGREYLRLEHFDDVYAVSFSKDGKSIATASADKTARIWDSFRGTEFLRMAHPVGVESIVLIPDGIHAATIGGGTASIWEISKYSEKKFFNLAGFGLSPDNKHFVGTPGRATTTVFEIDSGEKGRTVYHNGEVGKIVFAPDGKWVATSDGYLVKVWDITSEGDVFELAHSRAIWRITFSPNGRMLATASSPKDGFTLVRIWDWEAEQDICQFQVPGEPVFLVFSEDDQYIAVTAFESMKNIGIYSAWLFDSATGQEINHFQLNGGERALAYNLAEDQFLAYESVPESPKGEPDEIIEIIFPPSPIISPDGRYQLEYSKDWFSVVEIATGIVVFQTEHEREIVRAVFSQDGRYVVTSSWSFYISDNRYVRFWTWQPDAIIEEVCDRLYRNLSFSEWVNFIGNDEPYHATCPNLDDSVE